MNTQPQRPHSIILTGRKKAEITGVTELLSYDENAVMMTTSAGSLALEGKDLHVDRLSLDSGEISVCGDFSGIYYYDRQSGKSGFWSKIIG